MDEPISGFCDLCQRLVTVLPGPQRRMKRADWVIPTGYVVGYIVEIAHRSFLICRTCVDRHLLAAA